MTRTECRLRITRRLVLMNSVVLGAAALIFSATLFWNAHFMVSWLVFGCGLLGGFISIQQRLDKLSSEDLRLLAQSWFQVALIPVYGGVFACVLYFAFMGGIVSGGAFPTFHMPTFSDPPKPEEIDQFARQAYPASPQDLAKLFFWSVVAGFSERFVPQIIGKAAEGEKEG